jgi:hypothetical protein
VQKFTRPLTREIELGGERIALTLSHEGVAIRPVGSRKPPHAISWAGLVWAVTRSGAAEAREPTAEEVSTAVAAVKEGAPAKPAAQKPEAPLAPPGPADPPSAGGETADPVARVDDGGFGTGLGG